MCKIWLFWYQSLFEVQKIQILNRMTKSLKNIAKI
nr:MAG TPA: hypothetical protein [Caudoviricetes sp.]